MADGVFVIWAFVPPPEAPPRGWALANGTRAPLQVDPALRGILLPFLQSLASRTKQAADLAAFTGELAEIVDRAVAAGPLASIGTAASVAPGGLASAGTAGHPTALSDALVPAAFYELLLNELAALGWERVVDVDATQRRLTISGTDAAGRRHDLR